MSEVHGYAMVSRKDHVGHVQLVLRQGSTDAGLE